MGAASMTSTSSEWISGLRARNTLQIGYGSLQRLAVLGKIRVEIRPGEPVKYRRADVERLARQPA